MLTNMPANGTLVLSNESISNQVFRLDAKQSDLWRLLDGHNLRILLFCRDDVDWVKSYYKQIIVNRVPIKAGAQATSVVPVPMFEEFAKSTVIDLLLNRDAVAARLGLIFNSSDIVLKDYDNRAAISNFAEFIGIDDVSQFATAKVVNSSIPDVHAEILRQAINISAAASMFVRNRISDLLRDCNNIQLRVSGASSSTFEGVGPGNFSYRPNMPLSYTQEEFEESVEALFKFRPGEAGPQPPYQ
ncbi:hypothetical protein [Hansschlegelia zhihuaiae]|uniref:Uncharacterized protein n=1 Tax=Hansschlegelia zhihuaiae TaxID=405005 RepID=A0A4Q0M7Z3_9HYPH|nr:hypothetical protein [Hansschlegelia zhihuaiae]RXF69248.1 hypothetical protein EK403_18860 [Hansschlegelia zhihuaiae]